MELGSGQLHETALFLSSLKTPCMGILFNLFRLKNAVILWLAIARRARKEKAKMLSSGTVSAAARFGATLLLSSESGRALDQTIGSSCGTNVPILSFLGKPSARALQCVLPAQMSPPGLCKMRVPSPRAPLRLGALTRRFAARDTIHNLGLSKEHGTF